ncbi:MAG: hypothetical protein AB7T38_02280 [Nitrospirales bacterium]
MNIQPAAFPFDLRIKFPLAVTLFLVSTLVTFCLSSLAWTQPVGNDEFYSSDRNQNTGRPFRDIPPRYPECAGLVHEYWSRTDELYAKAEERRGAVDPRSRQITKEINALAKERSEVGRAIQDCVRDASVNRRETAGKLDEDSEQRPLLKGEVKEIVEIPSDEQPSDETQPEVISGDTQPGTTSSSPQKMPQSRTPSKIPQNKPETGTPGKPGSGPKDPTPERPGKTKETPPSKKKEPENNTPEEGPFPPNPPILPHERKIPEPDEVPPPQQPKVLHSPKPDGPNFSLNLIDPPAFSYVKGLGKGFEDCAKDFGTSVTTLWRAVQAMMAGNFPEAEQILGIPAAVLKGIWEELNKPVILSPQGGKVTPEEESKVAYENGRAAAKRLCEAIPLGKVAKCVGGVFGKCAKAVKEGSKGVKKFLKKKGKGSSSNGPSQSPETEGVKGRDHDGSGTSGGGETGSGKNTPPGFGTAGFPRGPPFKTKPLSPLMSKLDKGELDSSYKVKYFTLQELERRKLSIKDGKIYWDNKPFDTQAYRGEVIYVMDEEGNFFWAVSEPKRVHHSSLGQGKPVAAAGTLKVENGVLTHLDRESGHYMPDESHLLQAESWLNQQGINTTGIVHYEVLDR